MLILTIVLRWLHIVAAATALGGTLFMRLALVPAAETLPEAERSRLLAAARRRWLLPVMLAVAALLASGFYNFMTTVRTTDVDKSYHMLFGVKFLLALGVFHISAMMVGRGAAAQRMQAQAKLWLTVNLGLLAVLVGISNYMRSMDKPPKSPAAVAQPAAVSSDPTAATP